MTAGCVSPKPSFTGQTNGPDAAWEAGKYSVAFHAGPGSPERTFSFYQVEYRSAGGEPQRLTLESAQTEEGFQTVTNPAPKNHIRVVTGGEVLMIEEDIPNDCGPCRNYAFVRPDGNGYLECKWLRLPEKSHPGGGINYENPTVTGVSGETVTYRYSDGGARTVKVAGIPVMARPQRPG